MSTTVRSFCRICIAACGTLVTVDGDQVVEVRGDPDHPLSHGYLCPKGRALGDLHHHPDRLSGAFVRADGALGPAPIDEAVDQAAAALAGVIADHGPGSVGFFMGSGGFIDPAATFAARKFRQALGTNHNYSTATVDGIARVVVTSLVAGTTAVIPHVGPDSRLVVFVGSNPVVSHGQFTGFANPVEWLRAARARGEVWVVDPRVTETARHADGHLPARPGTDPAVLAFLIRDVLARRDAASFDALTADGLTELGNSVERFDVDHAAAVTGLSTGELARLADAVHRAGQLAVVPGTGSTMSVAGNLTEWLAWALMIVTDSVDRSDGVWFNPGFLTRLDERPTLPAAATGLPAPLGCPGALNVGAEWPAALIPDEIESGRLRALIVTGGNAAVCLPDTERLTAALQKLDVLIVLELFANETGVLATHLFACPDQLERPDLPGLDLYLPARMTQYTHAVVESPADRPPGWLTLAQIASRCGYDLVGDPATTTTDDVLRRVARGADFDALGATDGAPVVEDPVYGWVTERLPDGCWHLAPPALVAQLAAWSPGDASATLVLTPRRQLRRENTRAYRDGERMEAWLNPVDAARRGLNDGDMVVVRSSTGQLTVAARVTSDVVAGAVAIPHGWGESNVNRLIDADTLDSLTGMPRLSGTPVEVSLA